MQKGKRIALAALGAAFLLGVGLMAGQLRVYQKAEQTSDLADQLLAVAEPAQPQSLPHPDPLEALTLHREDPGLGFSDYPLAEDAQDLLQLDYSQLQAVNPDVMGWIRIPGTNIDYPILRSQDNLDYLTHAWDGTESEAGSIFLECNNDPTFLNFNTILYGHHMGDGSFFAPLIHYRKSGFREENPHIYICTDDYLLRYDIFASYEARVESDTYRLYFESKDQRQAFLDSAQAASSFTTDLEPKITRPVLTLSTCTGTGLYATRWVVQATCTGIWEI